jgi:hypothetical protein
MANHSRTSFKKRQKEIARMEKQRDKAAKRQQRKLAPKDTGDPEIEPFENVEHLDRLDMNTVDHSPVSAGASD